MKPWELFWLVAGPMLVVLAAAAWLFLTPIAHAAPALCGVASHYGRESGRLTATGEPFPTSEPTAAMPSRLMLGKRVTVTDLATGRRVVVRVNDIGPAAWTHRIIDLSPTAARALGIMQRGTARVCLS